MKKLTLCFLVCALAILGIYSVALADWDEGEPAKWIQLPDLAPTGLDICVDNINRPGGSQRVIGDDFECTSTDKITGIHLWVSWKGDPDPHPQILGITLGIWSDNPMGPNGHSEPLDQLWTYQATPDNFTEKLYFTLPEEGEGWWDPAYAGWTPNADNEIWQININIDPSVAFEQQGNEEQPITYWLTVEIQLPENTEYNIGWKTRDRWDGQYKDAAVWYTTPPIPWHNLLYPEGHDYYPDKIDMAFVLTSGEPEELDFGDAPDSAAAMGYPTLLINDGARHIIGGPWLGDATDAPDSEPDGQPTANADGDDIDGNDDEDGVQIPVLVQGQLTSISFQVSNSGPGGAIVTGWIDYNGDKIFGDSSSGELIVGAIYTDGTYTPNFTPPVGSVVGNTYARFRISNDFASTNPYGLAQDGEVEDYKVTIEEQPPEDLEYGDAPEGPNAMAYPSLGVMGQFPTCVTIGPASWIQHTNFGAYFGQTVDLETDGNAGLCPGCFPPYDQDECFQDGDAGLMFPDSFTIDNALNVVTCSAAGNRSLGQTCAIATWGVDVDIWINNTMPGHEPYVAGWVNVLMDWDQSGNWGGSAVGACTAPEYVLQDLYVPPLYIGPLSALVTSGVNDTFIIGPNAGYVWTRFTLTERMLQDPTWDGSGQFEDGETEDYLLKVDPAPDPEIQLKFQQLPLNGAVVGDIPYWGHDELSTAYRNEDVPNIFEGCYMADDFADLEHSPVIKVKWWGSYLENEIMEPVNRFLIAFEKDMPAQGQPGDADYVPSHPGELIQSQFVHRASALPLNPGEFSETWIGPGGPPCNENLFEYEAVLENPFPEDPNTVYWIKIVALIEDPAVWARLFPAWQASGLSLCDFLDLPYSQQAQYGLDIPVTRWGWHDRDYTKRNPYASTPPAVNPGEHVAGTLPDGTEIWHFQDDAVSGFVFVDEAAPEMPFVDQPEWKDEYYKYVWQLCPNATQGVDGPEGIEQISKDLAFELWTNNDCLPSNSIDYADWVSVGKPYSWCWGRQCHADGDNSQEPFGRSGSVWVGYNDITVLVGSFQKPLGDPALDLAADYNRRSEPFGRSGSVRVGYDDIAVLLYYFQKPSVPNDCANVTHVTP